MLKAYYDRWYAPNNVILVIVGDVEPVAVLAQVKSLFGGIPRKELHGQPSIHPRPVQTQTIEGKTDRANGMVVAAFRLPGFDSANYAALNLNQRHRE
jgi:zinc protease